MGDWCWGCVSCKQVFSTPDAAWKHGQECSGWDNIGERHDWQSTSPDGVPDYRRNGQMWQGEKAHVRCTRCGCRTWVSRDELERRSTFPTLRSSDGGET